MLQSPATTTTPDDVFYILKSVVTRLLAMGSLSGVDKMLLQLREIFDRDYIGIIKRKMEDVYKNAGPVTSNARPDKIERENRLAFIVGPSLQTELFSESYGQMHLN